jgi:1-deoxy-D-xylulose-5-phosphate reductoisomerase
MRQKRVVVLGSTGSIGTNVLRVIESFPQRFKVVGLGANRNAELLAEQARRHRASAVSLGDAGRVPELKRLVAGIDPQVFEGGNGLVELAAMDGVDILVSAVVGAVGLDPVLEAVDRGLHVAIANKEPLVMAGEIVMERARKSGARIVPIDSEHSAVFQCLNNTPVSAVRKIVLTASGGPFYGKTRDELSNVTPAQALAHPTWQMGPKISVDSATLMNKGLEIIEAMWLFGIDVDRITVVIHPESVVHSLVEYVDGSIIAQMAATDMKLPIQYALTYPERLPTPFETVSLADIGQLSFARPERGIFPCMDYAYETAKCGGTMPVALNAANEVAVAAFLREELPFVCIPDVIRAALDRHDNMTEPTIDDVKQADREVRVLATAAIEDLRRGN